MRTGLYSERIRRIIEDFPVGEPFTNESIAGILKKEFERAYYKQQAEKNV